MTVNEGITVIDDLKLIHTRDSADALGIAQKQGQQYSHDYNFSYTPKDTISNIVVAGMGGSGLAAKAFKTWPGINVPFEVVQDYDLPSYVSRNTLLIASSYSGNTEETVSALNQALDPERSEDNRPMIIVVSVGGKLSEIASEYNLPNIKLPEGYQPRMTFGYQLRALCEIVQACDLANGLVDDLAKAGEWLGHEIEQFNPTVPTNANYAKQIALEIIGKSVVVYASAKFFPVAYKWKISFNENAKSVAWCSQYPEFNHNEFIGWTSHPVDKPYSVIDLKSSLDNDRIKKRFEISDQLLSGKRPSPDVIELKGEDVLQQMIWGIALGDFVTLYTAILNGIDPTPVDLIEDLKHKLQ